MGGSVRRDAEHSDRDGRAPRPAGIPGLYRVRRKPRRLRVVAKARMRAPQAAERAMAVKRFLSPKRAVPIAKMKEVEGGGKHLGEEIGEEDVGAGDGEDAGRRAGAGGCR